MEPPSAPGAEVVEKTAAICAAVRVAEVWPAAWSVASAAISALVVVSY